MSEPLVAVRAAGRLRDFAAAGLLTVADVQVAQRLGALAGESDQSVLLAVALTVRGTRHGSVVLDLTDAAVTITADEDDGADTVDRPEPDWPEPDAWIAACAVSPLTVGGPGGSALRMAGSRLWLSRYWEQEAQVAAELRRRSAPESLEASDVPGGPEVPARLDADQLRRELDELFPAGTDADQRWASEQAALTRVSVIAGGPGTGKTTTIARLITVLRRQHPGLRIALAAPTGKAAARLTEAVHAAGAPLTAADQAALGALTASTLHRLLGRRPGMAGRFRHDRDNRLPVDVVVIDECSMVSLTLMARLLEALAPGTRLVLVGDPDQLASVEAGAVLGDLVDPVGPAEPIGPAEQAAPIGAIGPNGPTTSSAAQPSVTRLRTVHRFAAGGPIAALAECARTGRAEDAVALLRTAPAGIQFFATPDDEPVTGPALGAIHTAVRHERAVIEAARRGDVDAALGALDRHRLLCAHRSGPRGVRHWSDTVQRWLAADDAAVNPRLDGYYAGQPLLVTANDYDNGLFNGDTGVVVTDGDELAAAFHRGGQSVLLPLVRLSEVRPLHAMTIHRAQGSQFDEVTILLPAATSPLATRQTFYTAITRAASVVRLIGSEDAVRACIERPAARATGLGDRLAGRLG